MKKRCLALALSVLLSLAGCEKVPVETLPTLTEPVETTAAPTTLPPETTTPPETTVPPETTEPVVLEFPEGEVQAALLWFADMLYVREDVVEDALPDGYWYVGQVFREDPTKVPSLTAVSCHIPMETEVYASLTEPDYLYFLQDGMYRRMVRAALVENYWDDTVVDATVPENYTHKFFEALLTIGYQENYYNHAAGMEFKSPAQIDLRFLFYSGFNALDVRKVPLTEAETAFLLENGFANMPLTDVERFPEAYMDAELQRFCGITLDQTHRVGLEELDAYDSENKCYYALRTGLNRHRLMLDGVEYDAQQDRYILTVTIDSAEKPQYKMTLRPGDHVLQICSNVRVSGG